MSLVEIDQEQLDRLGKKLERFSDKITASDLLVTIATDLKNMILLRTGAGVDASGKSFQPYSQPYGKNKGSKVVNLFLTGEMLNGMTQKALSKDSAMIYFMTEPARQKARYHNILGAGKRKVIRKFFGVTDLEYGKAMQGYQNAVAKAKREEAL